MTKLKYILSKISTPATTNILFRKDIYNNTSKFFTDNLMKYSTYSTDPSLIWKICINNPIYYTSGADKYFYIDIIFDSYTYKSYYESIHADNFVNKITKKNYNIFLYVDLEKIIKCKSIDVLNILSKLFTLVQINQIKSKKTYMTYNIDKFISERESIYLHLDKSWFCFQMDLFHMFDMKNKKIISDKKLSQKIFFARTGGIIETNNVEKIINLFKNNTNDLILLPESLSYLWSSYTKIIFENIISMSIFELKSYFQYILKKKYNRIIIHECNEKILPIIKIIADIINPKTIWIINALPLRYYFNKLTKINLNNLLSISNLWLCFNNDQKKIYKIELLYMLFVNFNKLYTRYYYDRVPNINSIKINLFNKCNSIEKYIYDKINSYYINWKNQLYISDNNIYSTATRNNFLKIESDILNIYFDVINKIVTISDIYKIIPNIYRNENNLCPICYDADNPIQTILFGCGHQFCFDCIIQSLSKSFECPICRKYCDIKNIFIFPSLANIPHGIMSYLNSKINSTTQLITQIPFFEKYKTNNDHISQIIVLEKNISMHMEQYINYGLLNNKKVNIIYTNL